MKSTQPPESGTHRGAHRIHAPFASSPSVFGGASLLAAAAARASASNRSMLSTFYGEELRAHLGMLDRDVVVGPVLRRVLVAVLHECLKDTRMLVPSERLAGVEPVVRLGVGVGRGGENGKGDEGKRFLHKQVLFQELVVSVAEWQLVEIGRAKPRRAGAVIHHAGAGRGNVVAHVGTAGGESCGKQPCEQERFAELGIHVSAFHAAQHDARASRGCGSRSGQCDERYSESPVHACSFAMTLAKSANGEPSASRTPAVLPGASTATSMASATSAAIDAVSAFMRARMPPHRCAALTALRRVVTHATATRAPQG